MAAPIYEMVRHTVVAPKTDNRGATSGYPELFRAALERAHFTGWTEYETAGYWKGTLEYGVTFELYLDRDYSHILGPLARGVMPDQEAIQVTVDPVRTRVLEY